VFRVVGDLDGDGLDEAVVARMDLTATPN